MKTCTKCGATKALADFYANPSSPDGRRGDCKACVLASRADRYATDPDYRGRVIARSRRVAEPTKARDCRRCGASMRSSRDGSPGLCVNCKRALGYKVKITRAQRLEIYERDGWICQICYTPVEPTLHPNHTYAATLDHIVPRSLADAPDDSPGNLRLAHRVCNSARSNRIA